MNRRTPQNRSKVLQNYSSKSESKQQGKNNQSLLIEQSSAKCFKLSDRSISIFGQVTCTDYVRVYADWPNGPSEKVFHFVPNNNLLLHSLTFLEWKVPD